MNPESAQANRNALIGMLLGISGMMLSCFIFGGVIAVAGMWYSILAVNNAKCTKKGRAVAGIITSAIGIIVMIVAIFVVMIAMQRMA